MNEIRKYMLDFGYNDDDINKICNAYPLNNLRVDTLYDKIKENSLFLLSLGYSKNDIIKMTKLLPALLAYGIENIRQKLDDLIELGYSREYVIKMTKLLPALFGYSIENIKQKLDDLIELGYSRENVIKMTKLFPALFSLSIENVKKKLDFYGDIGIGNVFINDTKNLMQSVELSYARYYFLYDRGIVIDESNYGKLFYGNKAFEKQFGVSKDYLLDKYPYEENKRKKSL